MSPRSCGKYHNQPIVYISVEAEYLKEKSRLPAAAFFGSPSAEYSSANYPTTNKTASCKVPLCTRWRRSSQSQNLRRLLQGLHRMVGAAGHVYENRRPSRLFRYRNL